MTAHRYWRLYNIKNGDGTFCTITELIMATSAGGASVCTGGTASASTEYGSGWVAAAAFDGTVSGDQGWASASVAAGAIGQWLAYDFGAGNAKDIIEVRIVSRSNPAGLNQTPKYFRIEYSDDGTSWSQRGMVQVSTADWTANETRTFSIGSSDAALINNTYLRGQTERSIELDSLRVSNLQRSTTGDFGFLAGTVKKEGVVAAGVKLQAFDATSNLLLGETTSNILGEWEIGGLGYGKKHFIIATHPDTTWEKKISSRREPFQRLKLRTRAFSGEVATITSIA